MSLLSSLRSLASSWFARSRVSRDIDDELGSHIAHRADDLERSGLSRPEAERRARIEFGGYQHFKEESQQALGGHLLETLVQDIRFGLRMMRRKPSFTVVAVLSLALAIAANVIVFSVLNSLVLQPIDLPQARNLWMVEYGTHHFMQSYPDYLYIRDHSRAFEGALAFGITTAGIDSGQGSSKAWLCESSGNYFDVLQIQPYLGRFFHSSDEHGPGSAPSVVLSYAYWKSHFQGDPGVVGKTIAVNKYPFTILGVAPARFQGTALFMAPEVWSPIVNQTQIEGDSNLDARGARSVWVIARTKSGTSLPQVKADLASIASQLSRAYPKEDDGASFHLARPELMGDYVGQAIRAFVGGLMLLAGLILLAACANLGSLFAARAADRAKEVALRLALGSSRTRIMRQLLTEATMISLGGGAVGMGLSVVLLHRLSALKPLPDVPIQIPVNPDATVYLVALLLALLSGLLFGMIPVRQVLASEPYQVIKSSGSGVGRRFSLRDLLLAGQIAICAVLVTSSFVAVRGLVRMMNTNFGFAARNVMLVDTDLAMARYSSAEQPQMQRRMRDALERIPGVTGVAYANSVPLNMDTNFTNVYTDATTDLKESKAAAQTTEYHVSPEYFRTMDTALLAGRAFTAHDDMNAPRVAIVNGIFARQVFGSAEKALGGVFKTRTGTRIQVVGIAEDGKYINLAEDPQAAMFLPILQAPTSATWMVVRSRRYPQQVAAALRTSLHGLDAGLPVSINTYARQMDISFFPARMATLALGVLGALGALLSVTGLFGMAAYSVSKRLREFGIRIALGAQKRELLQAALGRTFQLLAYGSAAGLLLGVAAGKVLAVIVYTATPWDPVVLGGVLLTMLILGMLAGWIPALRALSTDPLALLREE